MKTIQRAISIRQPFAEQIVRGDKAAEYRSRPTSVKERVFIYAALRPASSPAAWRKIGKKPGQLVTGAIIGSVEIAGCKWDSRRQRFAYVLRKPVRLRSPRKANNQPNPCFWKPKFS